MPDDGRYLLSAEYLAYVTAELTDDPVFRWLGERTYFLSPGSAAQLVASIMDDADLDFEDKQINLANLDELLQALGRAERLVHPDAQVVRKWGELQSRQGGVSDSMEALFLATAIVGGFTVVAPRGELFERHRIPYVDPRDVSSGG